MDKHEETLSNLKEVEKYSINKLSQNEIKDLQFIKVMFGTRSNAGEGFDYKIDEVNETENWHPETNDSKDIEGFNFSVKEKILRWLVRGDTLYDVTIPSDTEVYDCESPSAPHGVFRSNRIIISNPRPVTDDIAMEFYKVSMLPEKSYFKAMAGCVVRGYIKTAMKILEEKVNKDNVSIAISEFEDFIKTKNDVEFYFNDIQNENIKMIYNKLREI